VKVRESVSIKSVRGLSVMWGGDGEWPFFVKAPDFSRKDAMACMPSLVPRRSPLQTMEVMSVEDCH